MLSILTAHRTILGMNARNLRYIRPMNRKKAIRLADDKLASKRLLHRVGIPVPQRLGVIKTRNDLTTFDWSTLPESFVVKPNRGFGGGGIIVLYRRVKGRSDAWVTANGSVITSADLTAHIQNILEGSYSLAGTPDIAFFEERLRLLKLFKPYTFKGVPDIRVIVYNNVPVMAMLRLPTRESGGKANLAQGAIGVGIDLAAGTTTTALLGKNKIIETLPGTDLPLSGIHIPYWKKILTLAVEAQKASLVGFLGADVAIDRDKGPVFLELNARPGLSIQVANQAGLKERLERVRGLNIKTTERGVAIGMRLFGGEIEEEVEEISGKKVIGAVEKVTLIGKNGKEITMEAKIDTGADSTSIGTDLARDLGFEHVLNAFNERIADRDVMKDLSKKEREMLFTNIEDLTDTVPVQSAHGTSYRPIVQIQITIDKLLISPRVSIIDRSHLRYSMIIGRKDLGRFLVDSSKRRV